MQRLFWTLQGSRNAGAKAFGKDSSHNLEISSISPGLHNVDMLTQLLRNEDESLHSAEALLTADMKLVCTLSDSSGTYTEDIIRGVRLGNRVVGRKSRFASFDPQPKASSEAAAGLAAVSALDTESATVLTELAAVDGGVCGVEALALQHYARAEGGGWHGVHCEGGCLLTLFGILMWDVLFAAIPGPCSLPIDFCSFLST